MVLTASRLTPELANTKALPFGVTAAVQCFAGGLAIVAAGFLRPGRVGQGVDNAAKAVDAATYRCVGIFEQDVLGGVANGDVEAVVRPGAFPFAMGGGGDALTNSDAGKACYIIDDNTVGKTNPNATRCVAGTLLYVRDGSAFVDIHPSISAALTA